MIWSSGPMHRAILPRAYHLKATTVVDRMVQAIVGPSACQPISLLPRSKD